jgi:HD-like signal output (HDOD) protein
MPQNGKSLQIDPAAFQLMLDQQLSNLPPLPAVVLRIIEIVNREDSSASELNRLISLDQGLSTRLLRIVNSAYYGFPRRISTVTHAIVILGFNAVRNLVLGVSAFDMLSRKHGTAGLNREHFWKHSVAAAMAASIIVEKRHTRASAATEESFLSGLLHDVGQLFLDCYFPTQYAVAVAYADRESVPSVEAERRLLGIDHAMVAQRVAEAWNFPPSLAGVLGGHHDPDPSSPMFDGTAVVHAADWLAWCVGMGSASVERGPQLHPAVVEWLQWDDETLQWARQELSDRVSAASDLVHLIQR